jgi:hypothetical protein
METRQWILWIVGLIIVVAVRWLVLRSRRNQ